VGHPHPGEVRTKTQRNKSLPMIRGMIHTLKIGYYALTTVAVVIGIAVGYNQLRIWQVSGQSHMSELLRISLICIFALSIFGGGLLHLLAFRMSRSHPQANVDARPMSRSEVYEIGFGYLPGSPLSNGWKVPYQDPEAKPSFASPEAPGIGGLSMDVKNKYAIRYALPRDVQFANELDLAVKYGEGAMFHVIVNVTSRDGSLHDEGQIKILIGNAPPQQHKDYPKEYLVWVTPERLQNGWVKMQHYCPVKNRTESVGWRFR